VTSTPYWQDEEAFKDAVREATTAAVAEYVTRADDARRSQPVWMLIVAVLIGVVLGAGVSIPTTIVLNNRTHNAARENSRENCRLITALAAVDETTYKNLLKQTADFERKSRDRFGLSQGDFAKLVAKEHEGQAAHLRAIQAVAKTNCTMTIR
jgi:hypothetical protein